MSRSGQLPISTQLASIAGSAGGTIERNYQHGSGQRQGCSERLGAHPAASGVFGGMIWDSSSRREQPDASTLSLGHGKLR